MYDHLIETPLRMFFFNMGLDSGSAMYSARLTVVVAAILIVYLLFRWFRRKPAAPAQAFVGAAASGLTEAAMEELERAQALLKQGTITPLEFERMKAKIINM